MAETQQKTDNSGNTTEIRTIIGIPQKNRQYQEHHRNTYNIRNTTETHTISGTPHKHRE